MTALSLNTSMLALVFYRQTHRRPATFSAISVTKRSHSCSVLGTIFRKKPSPLERLLDHEHHPRLPCFFQTTQLKLQGSSGALSRAHPKVTRQKPSPKHTHPPLPPSASLSPGLPGAFLPDFKKPFKLFTWRKPLLFGPTAAGRLRSGRAPEERPGPGAEPRRRTEGRGARVTGRRRGRALPLPEMSPAAVPEGRGGSAAGWLTAARGGDLPPPPAPSGRGLRTPHARGAPLRSEPPQGLKGN